VHVVLGQKPVITGRYDIYNRIADTEYVEAGIGHGWSLKRMFFFAKKNQKTLATDLTASRSFRQPCAAP
jgi:hypothetical protein